MKYRPLLVVLLLTACAPQAVTSLPAPQISAPEPASRAYPAVQAFAEDVVASGRVPAISIAIAAGDEKPTFISAGRLSPDPASPRADADSLWRIYSMTKPVTGIAAMILVDEGKLKLDQPVSDFIPDFAASRVLIEPDKSLATRPASRPVTIRDLLTHTSGLSYAIVGKGPAFEALQKEGLTPFTLNRAAEADARRARPATLAEFGARAGQSALIADPGTRFSYSMSLDVLAAVIERAADQPFETFVQQRLFDPLEMRSTYWQVPATDADRLVDNVAPKAIAGFLMPGAPVAADARFVVIDDGAGSVFLDKPSFPYGGAGLVSSARDYDRFLHMLAGEGKLGGVRILSAKTARLAMSNLMPPGVILKDVGPLAPGEEAGFGAGGFVTTRAFDGLGRGRGTYGWDGAAGSRGWTDPTRRVRATMMINAMGAPNVGSDFDKALASDLAARSKRP